MFSIFYTSRHLSLYPRRFRLIFIKNSSNSLSNISVNYKDVPKNNFTFPLEHSREIHIQSDDCKKTYYSSYKNKLNTLPVLLSSIIYTTSKSSESDADEDLLQFSKMGNLDGIKRYISKNYVSHVDTRHTLGWTPLMSAVINGHYEIVEYLIKSGSNVNAEDDYAGHYRSAKKLSMNSGEVNVRRLREFSEFLNPSANFKGSTALHYAVFKNDTRMVKVLLEAGADPTKENETGHKPLMYAREDNVELITLLKNYEQKALRVREEREKEERRKNPLENRIKEHIIGQEAAINTVASAIRRKENGWYDEEHPLVLLFLGSSGVGKTELAKQIANYLHKNDKKAFIRIDMSEYQHKHEVAKFIGSPPGYVGHDSGGQLTKALTECPKAVVLFDEVEKAHPDVLTSLLQLFDEGRLTDGQGKTIICKDAIFIMTSNVASEEIAEHAQKLRQAQEQAEKNHEMEYSIEISRDFKEKIMRPILKAHFHRDEFLGRINEMVYFLPFSRSELTKLVSRELGFWKAKAKEKHNIALDWDSTLIDTLVDGYDIYYGARSLKYEVERRVISKIALAHERALIKPGCKIFLSSRESEKLDESNKTKHNRPPEIKMKVTDPNSSFQKVVNLESEPVDL